MKPLTLADFRPPNEGTRLALGFFDGFHLGHQALTTGADHVFTFTNHPSSVLDARRTPPLITDFEERVRRLAESGLQVVVRDFDRPFSQMPPLQFLEEIVDRGLGARRVRVGPNYRFGHKAAGDIELLKQFGEQRGLTIEIVEPVEHEGELISSTRIRGLVQQGQVGLAAELLGRPFEIRSVVEKGDARGRQLGFPTANLTVPSGLLKPRYGVYAVEAAVEGEAFLGVANFGVRPTVGKEKELLEVHLLDIERDLYGLRLQVKFRAAIRQERKFSNFDELQAQIKNDVASARKLHRRP